MGGTFLSELQRKQKVQFVTRGGSIHIWLQARPPESDPSLFIAEHVHIHLARI